MPSRSSWLPEGMAMAEESVTGLRAHPKDTISVVTTNPQDRAPFPKLEGANHIGHTLVRETESCKDDLLDIVHAARILASQRRVVAAIGQQRVRDPSVGPITNVVVQIRSGLPVIIVPIDERTGRRQADVLERTAFVADRRPEAQAPRDRLPDV